MQDMSAKTEARGSAVSNAFSDLDALMETANGMVPTKLNDFEISDSPHLGDPR